MKNKRKAFTLAEVLITITILGIISVIILPALKNNADKVSWAKGLAVNTNILKNGFERMLADNEADTLDLTPLWTKAYEEDDLYDVVKKELRKYFVFNKFEKQNEDPYKVIEYNGTEYEGINGLKLYLSNGAIIYFSHRNPFTTNKDCDTIKENGGNLCETNAYIIIDVNGKNGPNTLGKDIFGYFLDNHGYLYPEGGKDAVVYGDTEKNTPLWNSTEGCKDKTPVNGLACTARVVEEGYKINY